MAVKLNATAGSLLGFLLDGPLTGWDLVSVAQQRVGSFWSLTQSQVYRELTAMAETGLVAAGERGSRDRRPYSITDAGRAAFGEWVAQDLGTETIRFPLLVTVLFGRHLPPARLAEIMSSHRRAHARRLGDYLAIRDQLPPQAAEAEPFAIATLDFGIAYEEAVMRWFENLPAAIAGPSVATS